MFLIIFIENIFEDRLKTIDSKEYFIFINSNLGIAFNHVLLLRYLINNVIFYFFCNFISS